LKLSPKFLKDHLAVNVAVKGSKIDNRFANTAAIGSATYFGPNTTYTMLIINMGIL
jgi:iron complex outermembrane receptor protein